MKPRGLRSAGTIRARQSGKLLRVLQDKPARFIAHGAVYGAMKKKPSREAPVPRRNTNGLFCFQLRDSEADHVCYPSGGTGPRGEGFFFIVTVNGAVAR